jgi:hypothetical protein
MYSLSKDYIKLYQLLCEGNEVVCYIDYDDDINGIKQPKHICTARRRTEDGDIFLESQIMEYVALYSYGATNMQHELTDMCLDYDLEYIPPPDPQHEALWKLFEEFQRQNQSAAGSSQSEVDIELDEILNLLDKEQNAKFENI